MEENGNKRIQPKFNFKYSDASPDSKNSSTVKIGEAQADEKIANLINPQGGTHYTKTDVNRIWLEAIQIIQKMNDYKRENNNEYDESYTPSLKRKFKWFYTNYPSLFNMITDVSPKNENQGKKMQRLKDFLNRIEKIKLGYINYEKETEKLGQEYYNEWHLPKINKN